MQGSEAVAEPVEATAGCWQRYLRQAQGPTPRSGTGGKVNAVTLQKMPARNKNNPSAYQPEGF
jgi:hypothetical protein